MTIETQHKPLMVLGTSSGAGKSLITTAICKSLKRQGKSPLPFKGQNMSNNAWVDKYGREMAYSQAVQAWASSLDPIAEMNPVLLKPKGDCTSEVIHLGKSVGITMASNYYENWVEPGWETIKRALKQLISLNTDGRFILEGAGSPVEVNLQHKDITNLKLARFLNANCILVADIERGGVFAQIVGTLQLLKPEERQLIKGIIINRFRGDISLFTSGKEWLERHTGIPVLGIMPWINEFFPPEDTLDLLGLRPLKSKPEIEIAVIRLPSLSNFSDLDPLIHEDSVQIRWVSYNEMLGEPDAVIIPGSKQTIKDLELMLKTNLANEIKDFAKSNGSIFGLCGGLQILGKTLEDPLNLEDSQGKNKTKIFKGLNLIPIHTIFKSKKTLSQRKEVINWPTKLEVNGFELHHGESQIISNIEIEVKTLFDDKSLGWVRQNNENNFIGGTYLHGIFDNGKWRRQWINQLRKKKGLKEINTNEPDHKDKRNNTIDLLANVFEENIQLNKAL